MLNRALFIGSLGGAAVAGAIGVNVYLWEQESAPPPPVAQQVTTQPQTPAETEAVKPAPVAPAPPSFDVVRITPDGNAVIAGRAQPGSTVVIIDRGQFVGQLEADPNGEWVFLTDGPLQPGRMQLSLKMSIDGGDPVASDDVVVLVVPEPNKDIAGQPVSKPAQALALKVSRSGEGGSTVLQKPAGDGSGTGLSVDSIDYDDDENLYMSGHADAERDIYLYLDNDFIGQTRSDNDGGWQLRPSRQIAPGLYTLRVDQVDQAGKVMARISLPLARAEPLADLTPEPFVVVQPGNSLWRLARRTYGSGVSYTIIYEANREQIQDADLIYPGQIFALPATN